MHDIAFLGHSYGGPFFGGKYLYAFRQWNRRRTFSTRGDLNP